MNLNVLTDVLHYDVNLKKRVKWKNCEILNEFMFAKNTFYVASIKNFVMICYPLNGELIYLKGYKGITYGEAMSNFRNGYIKNGINKERLELFLTDPEKHKKVYDSAAGKPTSLDVG